MQNVYPTAEEIMSAPVNFRKETIEIVNAWKKDCMKGWKNQSTAEKNINLSRLVHDLNKSYNGENGKDVTIVITDKYAYRTDTRTIMMDKDHPSIISTLHEFAHHLYGHSEYHACRWSVWLFKTCFPKSFETLDFKGHLLVKRLT